MGNVNRRNALSLLSATGAAAILGGTAGSATAGDKAEQADLFVLGPFRVGDWFQAKPSKIFTLPDAPAVAELVKALNQTRVYLIDRRAGKVFADGFPLVAVEGALRHQWEKGKRTWEVHVVSAAAPVSTTDNSASPPTREIGALAVALWTRERKDEELVGESVWNFSQKSVWYDITGTMRGA